MKKWLPEEEICLLNLLHMFNFTHITKNLNYTVTFLPIRIASQIQKFDAILCW